MCARELPELDAVRGKYQEQGVSFLALSLEPDEQVVLDAARKLSIEMPVAIAQGEVLGPLGVNQVPSTVFIDRDGTIVAAANGERKRSFLEARVKELLPPQPAR
jgi:hypothetical protein